MKLPLCITFCTDTYPYCNVPKQEINLKNLKNGLKNIFK